MRHGDEVAQEALDALLKAGADKASCGVSTSVVTELNVERAQIGLLRSTMNVNVNLMAIKDQKKGSVSLNSLEPSAIDRAATDTPGHGCGLAARSGIRHCGGTRTGQF